MLKEEKYVAPTAAEHLSQGEFGFGVLLGIGSAVGSMMPIR